MTSSNGHVRGGNVNTLPKAAELALSCRLAGRGRGGNLFTPELGHKYSVGGKQAKRVVLYVPQSVAGFRAVFVRKLRELGMIFRV